jgi:hypothetical protein
MKRARDEHIGMKISLNDDTFGKVLKVSDSGYKVKASDKKFTIPLAELKLSKKGLLRQCQVDLVGKICQLQNCGPLVDGNIVKVVYKNVDLYRFFYSTGCGGETPARCLVPISKDTSFDKSWENMRFDKDGYPLCGCCGKPFAPEGLELFYVPLKEWHKQGVICKSCLHTAGPLLNLVKSRPEEDIERIGAKVLHTFNTVELLELNTAVLENVTELAKRHAIQMTEVHKQIRPTAMEYTVCFKLTNDVTPEQADAAKVSAIKAAKLVKKMNTGLKDVRTKKRSAK